MKQMIKFLLTVTAISLSDKVFRLIYDMIVADIDNNLVFASYASVSALIGLMRTVTSGVSFGATVHYNTSKDREKSFSSSLYTVICVSTAIVVLCLLLRGKALEVVGISSDMYDNSNLVLIGCNFSLLFTSITSFLQTVLIMCDKAKVCLILNITMRTVKVFMLLPCDNLQEVVTANVLYDILIFIVMSLVFKYITKYKLHKFDLSSTFNILGTGIPVMIYSSCYPIGNLSISKELNKIGISALSSSSVINTIDSVIYCFYNATWDLVAKYVGDYVREGKLYKVKSFIRNVNIIIIIFQIVFICTTLVFDKQIFTVIGLNTDYHAMCTIMLRLNLYTCIIDGFSDIYYATMNTIKKVKIVSMFPLITIGLTRVLYVSLFYIDGDISSLYLVYPVSYIINLITVYIIYRVRSNNGRWDKEVVIC